MPQMVLMCTTGESLRGSTRYYLAKKEIKSAESLKRPQNNSFPSQETYHCSYGPQDHRNCLPEILVQPGRIKDSRASNKTKGNSCRRGCLASFVSSILYLSPDITQLTIRHEEHTDAAGHHVHGCHMVGKGVKHLHGPALSQTMKEWVRTRLLNGDTTRQIMAQHTKSALPRTEAGTADRDCFLSAQDVRNVAHKLARLTWKLHENEAQSVRIFYQQHADHMFIYEEQHAGQPPQAPQQQPAGLQH